MRELALHAPGRSNGMDSIRGARRDGLADEELMRRVQLDDTRAFELLYYRHGAAAFRLAVGLCKLSERAADVTQEAFLALWRSRALFDPSRGDLRSWILTLVRHKAFDTLRRTRTADRLRAGDDGLAERLEAPERTEAVAVERADARAVRSALALLPSEQRRVIELAYYAGYTHREIALSLDIPPGTVKGRMRLGLAKLRAQLASTQLQSCPAA